MGVSEFRVLEGRGDGDSIQAPPAMVEAMQAIGLKSIAGLRTASEVRQLHDNGCLTLPGRCC